MATNSPTTAAGKAGPIEGWNRYRAGAVVAWVLLSSVSVALAFSGGEDNPIGAEVRVVDLGYGVAIAVMNNSDEIWKNVTVTLSPEGWVHAQPVLRNGGRISLEVSEFHARDSERKHPPRDHMPKGITVTTDLGTYIISAKKAGGG